MEEKAEVVSQGYYCMHCGKPLAKEAVVCPNCGIAVRGQSLDKKAVPKDKTIAVLLAIFLGFWTWIYTYETDSWKFWLNLALTVVTMGTWSFVAWIWSIVDVAAKPDSFYVNYPNC